MKIQSHPLTVGNNNIPAPGEKLIRIWAEQPVSVYYLYNGDEKEKLRILAGANSFECPFPYPVDPGDVLQAVNTVAGNVIHFAYE